ncbi:MAG: hypothetical protein ABIO67_08425, partial [Mycobacteriales bacterium]
VDQALAALLAQREPLLASLRPGTVLTPAATAAELPTSSSVSAATRGAAGTASGVDWMSNVPGGAGRPRARPSPEWTPKRVQNTLLGLGVLLLTVAGIVFAAVTYDRLGASGRAGVLVTLTIAAGLAAPRLTARGLDATAEAVTAVTLTLAALDAYGLRTLGLAEESAGTVYAAGSSLVLAITAALYALAVPVLLPRFAAVALAHLPVPLLLAHTDASSGETGLALAVLAAADLGAWVLLDGLPNGAARRDARAAVLTAGAFTALIALLAGTVGAFSEHETAGTVALLTLATTSASASLVAGRAAIRFLLTALPAPLAAAAAFAISSGRLTAVQQPLVLAAVALAAVQLAALLPRSWRPGPTAGALVVLTAALATQSEALAQAVIFPFAWLDAPWTLVAGRDARQALAPDLAWDGTVVTLVVLLSAAAGVAGAGLALQRFRTPAIATAALIVVSAMVLPLGLATSYPLALALLLGCATVLLAVGFRTPREELSLSALGAGGSLGLLAAAWALADQSATLLVLAVLTLLSLAISVRRPAAAGLAGVVCGGFVAAVGAARGLSVDQVGAVLLIVPTLLIGLTFVLDRLRRTAVEVAAAVLAATALVLASNDTGWLSWALAITGLLALADALHADRRTVAAAGALLLSASSWVRLADAGVRAPEPYVVPLGLAALALGCLRVRREPATRSFAAYGAGLSLLLIPSLVASFDDATTTRPLLIGATALVVLLVGGRARLQAPLVFGGAVLAIDALQLLGPYAAALPRWLTLGGAGLLLVAVGATYEQRRRDVARLRERFGALT